MCVCIEYHYRNVEKYRYSYKLQIELILKFSCVNRIINLNTRESCRRESTLRLDSLMEFLLYIYRWGNNSNGRNDCVLQVAGSIIGKGGQNITKLRSQVSRCFFRFRRFRSPRSCSLYRSSVFSRDKHERQKKPSKRSERKGKKRKEIKKEKAC